MVSFMFYHESDDDAFTQMLCIRFFPLSTRRRIASRSSLLQARDRALKIEVKNNVLESQKVTCLRIEAIDSVWESEIGNKELKHTLDACCETLALPEPTLSAGFPFSQ
jgi:hypothetical protein